MKQIEQKNAQTSNENFMRKIFDISKNKKEQFLEFSDQYF